MAAPSLDVEVEEVLFEAMMRRPVSEYADDLERVTNIDRKNASQRTMLHQAVVLGRVDWVRELLRRGADPSVRDMDG
jgi:hypothetical protein